ncbi:hypothetical protein B0H10DRAFT_1947682 [Mycena sp. CBHHK59/15]|nr:hypothetical protein B0H10DRAFT_1947682 [Mycena sp. CBHHK59/15]
MAMTLAELMSPIVIQLQALLAQLENLELQEPDPELEQQLLCLAAAAAATQNKIDKHETHRIQAGISPQNNPVRENNQCLSHEGLLWSDSSPPAIQNVSPWVLSASERNPLPNPVSPSASVALENNPLPNPVSPSVPVASEHPAVPATSVQPSSEPPLRHCFPWIEVKFDGTRPSESAFAKPGGPRQFGMPYMGILPLEPPLHLFRWPAESISKLGKPHLDKLVPAPAALPPTAGCFPQAPIYYLNSEPDHSYRRGWRYAAPFHTSDRQIEHDRMLNIQVPPNLKPACFDLHLCSFHSDPIPGMVKLPLGIPMVHHINVCGHSLDSLMQYDEGEQVKVLTPRLMTLTWGIAKTDTHPGVPGIFELPGMQKNLRSKNVDLSKVTPGDGSYNLASTRGEGEGHGIFMPAVQTNTPEAAAIIKEVLQILHKLYRLIMPLCISCFEWDMLEFNTLENNVVAFGGLEPGPCYICAS